MLRRIIFSLLTCIVVISPNLSHATTSPAIHLVIFNNGDGEMIDYNLSEPNSQPRKLPALTSTWLPDTNSWRQNPWLHALTWYGGWALLNSLFYYFRAPRLLAFNNIVGGTIVAVVIVKDAIRIFNTPFEQPPFVANSQ